MALTPAGSKPLLLLLLLVLFSVTCSYGNQNKQFIKSCGDIHNISFPFQLQGDPSNTCNDELFTLSCDENNRTFVHLFSGKYCVQSINYNEYNLSIRLVDVGIQTHDVASGAGSVKCEISPSLLKEKTNPTTKVCLEKTNSNSLSEKN
ncbi:hypothetical protein RHMOL_Rhmol03G0226400 [Rhododendron molle]|uniref:Uncharacterized protein n=1 Tax=Rhododendron molle TaxID=49168 RepID=A0ACC0PHL2_RHOML|nr:hypothetical protein RHMOL_Rhmol03G0226400 [Rhododendron molle]